MHKLILVVILSIFLPVMGQRTTEDRLEYGGFMRQNLEIMSTPLSYNSVPSNGFYHFQVGWIEPLYSAKTKTFKRTYIEPGIDIGVSPFSSSIGAFFHIKLFSWYEFKAGYKRQFYHSTLISYESKPSLDSWTSENLFSDISDKGEFAGGDIFNYGNFLTVPLKIAKLKLSYGIELLNIDQRGKHYLFDYSTDFLIDPKDKIRTIGTQLILFPESSMQLSFQNEYKWTNESEFEKNLFQISLLGLVLNKKNYIDLDLHMGSWFLHPQIDEAPNLKSFTLGFNLKWGLVILGKK